jgi:hypothetical protein
MSGLIAIAPLLFFLAIFAVVGARIWRISSLMTQSGGFRAAYMAHLREELRKAGIDPTEVDLDTLRRRKANPAEIPPRLQGAVIKAFTRTLRMRPSAAAVPHGLVPMTPLPSVKSEAASVPVSAPEPEPYRPPAIDAPSKARSKAIVAALFFALAAALALLLHLGASVPS